VVENAEDVRVALSDEREFAATIVGTDPQSDLAVLRIEGDPGVVQPLSLGDSDRLRLGDVVLAIGNPFGVGQTVTMGIISAVGRANVGIVDYEDFIQTDAAINPGNSGGALVDMEGNLVGINTAIISRSGGYQGIGFAIPSNMARRIMESLIETGRVERGWLGVAIQDMTQELAESFDLETSRGVLIADIVPDGPADAAGLRRGDIVLRIDGQSVDDMGRLRNLVASAGVGTKLRLQVLRDGGERHFDVELGERPDREQQLSTGTDAERSGLRGLGVAPLDASTRRRFDIADDVRSGVVVVDVAAGSPASAAGLRAGDVILEADRREIRSVRELEARLREKRGTVLLLISRARSAFFVPLEGER
jgi:serine protease Do